MLIRLLKEIANAETHTHLSLAKALKLDSELVKQMFYDLQRLGYIMADDSECGDEKCDECGVCCTKKNKGNSEEKISVGSTRWKLTEKGKHAALIPEPEQLL